MTTSCSWRYEMQPVKQRMTFLQVTLLFAYFEGSSVPVCGAVCDPCGFRDFMNNTRHAGAVGKKQFCMLFVSGLNNGFTLECSHR